MRKVLSVIKDCVYSVSYKILGDSTADKLFTRIRYKKTFKRSYNENEPKTLNDKILWLKLNRHDDFQTIIADKFLVREYWKQFGEDGLIPLWYVTDDWRKITIENIPDEPCIVKCNNGSGFYKIIRDKKKVDFEKLQKECRSWLRCDFYHRTQEWQYKNVNNLIIVEKLLLDKNGHIPNDYKLHYFNGKLGFIYCSIDREGRNYRSIYSPDWEIIPMEWVAPEDHCKAKGDLIPKPDTFNRMVEIANVIAQKFDYVRVDFYDVDGKLYYGEITLHHGGGFDTFVPESYDLVYGDKLIITNRGNI